MILAENWKQADRWQKSIRNRFLLPFYQQRAYQRRVVFVEKGGCASFLQKRMAVDTIFQPAEDRTVCVEEKIVQRPHDRFAFEYQSCTVPGHESDGWMKYAQADILLYAFQHTFNGAPVYLDAFVFTFPALQQWFWAQLPSCGWYKHTMPTQNQTSMYLVPITEVASAFPDSLRFVVADGGRYQQIALNELDTKKIYTQCIEEKLAS